MAHQGLITAGFMQRLQTESRVSAKKRDTCSQFSVPTGPTCRYLRLGSTDRHRHRYLTVWRGRRHRCSISLQLSLFVAGLILHPSSPHFDLCQVASALFLFSLHWVFRLPGSLMCTTAWDGRDTVKKRAETAYSLYDALPVSDLQSNWWYYGATEHARRTEPTAWFITTSA